jgi:hypothetical protein
MSDGAQEEYYCVEGIDELEEVIDEVLWDVNRAQSNYERYYSDELENVMQSSTAELTEVFHA